MAYQHAHWQIAPTGTDSTQGIDDLHQCIYTILSTRRGGDVLRPDFGSDHFDYIDYPHDVAIPNIIREIHTALGKWESRIIVQQVEITGLAPKFHCRIVWAVADDVARQIYQTEV